MSKIIAAVDGSPHTNSVLELSLWAAKKTNSKISLLHVVSPSSNFVDKTNLSGSIGLGAISNLLEELTLADEEKGKIEQRKGQLILDYSKTELEKNNFSNFETQHQRGSLSSVILEQEEDANLVVVGKYGQQEEIFHTHFGSNLEKIARTTTKPLLIATRKIKEIKRLLIAFDCGQISQKIVNFIAKSDLLKDLECHLLKVGDLKNEEEKLILENAKKSLEESGFKVFLNVKSEKSIEDEVENYIQENDINLLIIGAYSHSRIRNIILGSTTTSLIIKTEIPILLFK